MGLFSRKKDETPPVIDLRQAEPTAGEVGISDAVPGMLRPWVPGSHRPQSRAHVHALHAVPGEYEVPRSTMTPTLTSEGSTI